MDVTFRPARPDDAEAVVPLILSSGPAAFEYVFARPGSDATAFLRAAFLADAGEFGWPNHTVGESDGKVVATGAGHTGHGLAWTIAAARQILSHHGWASGWGTMVRGLRAESVIRPPKEGEWYLGHLGVAENVRGRGIGTRLIHHLLSLGDGYTEASLHVAETNARAQALYERLGFEVTEERGPGPANGFGRLVVHRRMAKPL